MSLRRIFGDNFFERNSQIESLLSFVWHHAFIHNYMKERHNMQVLIVYHTEQTCALNINVLFDPDERMNFIFSRSASWWLILFSSIQKEHELFLCWRVILGHEVSVCYQKCEFHACNLIIDEYIGRLESLTRRFVNIAHDCYRNTSIHHWEAKDISFKSADSDYEWTIFKQFRIVNDL
jgi:hypothetical protein